MTNRIEARRSPAVRGLVIAVDGEPVDAWLRRNTDSPEVAGLVPALTGLRFEGERRQAWECFQPPGRHRSIAPLLVCPDHRNLSCVVVVVEVEQSDGCVHWRRFGFEATSPGPARQARAGAAGPAGGEVDWLAGVPALSFTSSDYLAFLDTLRPPPVYRPVVTHPPRRTTPSSPWPRMDWVVVGLTVVLGVLLALVLPSDQEPRYRSPEPPRSDDGGAATDAMLSFPEDVAVDNGGNLYIADSGNNRVVRVGQAGLLRTVAGTGDAGFAQDRGTATATSFLTPTTLAVDSRGNVFIGEYLGRVRRVDPTGAVTTVAVGSEANDNRPAAPVGLSRHVEGLAVDRDGNLYIADTGNHRVVRVDEAGVIATVAGTGQPGFGGDGGPATAAQLADPTSLAVDAAGNLYIADTGNNRIRRVDPRGEIDTIALAELGRPARADYRLPDAREHGWGLAADGAGNVYFAEFLHHRIRRVDPSGTVTTVAEGGSEDPAVRVALDSPTGLAVDAAGNLYVSDIATDRVLRIGPPGTAATVAGRRG